MLLAPPQPALDQDAAALFRAEMPPGIIPVEQAALALEDVQRILAGAAPKKIIVVPGRMVNIVA